MEVRRKAVTKSKDLKLRIDDRPVMVRCKKTKVQEAEEKPLVDAMKLAKSHAIDKSRIRWNYKEEAIQVKAGDDEWKTIAKLMKEEMVVRWLMPAEKVNDAEAVSNLMAE